MIDVVSEFLTCYSALERRSVTSRYQDCDMKLTNLIMRPFYGVGEQNTKMFFFFF